LIRGLAPGDTVSYGRHFQADKKTKVAILPVGYSHGYPVALSSKGKVAIDGKIYPVAGRVCMDYTIIHLGEDSEVQEGDEAILIGSSNGASVTAVELARLAGTISYEIVTRLNLTLPRYYHD
jgi:alanine racemase